MAPKLVFALAGRRIDAPNAAPDAPERFRADREDLVRGRLRELFAARGAGTLVCSAACGSDLVGLEAARALNLRRRIVLPFSVEEFRATSVTDRGEQYGERYDRLTAEAQAAGDLVILPGKPSDEGIYLRANEAILDEALSLAGARATAAAVIVWEGRARAGDDATAGFAESARRRGPSVIEVSSRA